METTEDDTRREREREKETLVMYISRPSDDLKKGTRRRGSRSRESRPVTSVGPLPIELKNQKKIIEIQLEKFSWKKSMKNLVKKR